MDKSNLFKAADSFINFLWLIQNTVLKEHDLTKNFQSQHNKEKKCFCDFSLPPSHVRVIFYLIDVDSSPISQIADSLGISKPNMTPIIDNLIKYGLVTRYPDPNDRRILRVQLTPKTCELLDSLRISICNSFVEKISSLSADEVNTLDNSISNLIAILKKLK